MEPPTDDLAFLGLTPDTDLETLKATRNALVKAFHPDRFLSPQERAEAHEQTVRINASFERVSEWLQPKAQNQSDPGGSTREEEPEQPKETERAARARARQEEEARWQEDYGSRCATPEADAPLPETPGAKTETDAQGSSRGQGARGRYAFAGLALLFVAAVIWIGRRETAKQSSAVTDNDPSASVSRVVPPRTTRPLKVTGRFAPGEKRWEVTVGEARTAPWVGADGTAYVATSEGSIHALSGLPGATRWRTDLGTKLFWIATSRDGTIFAATSDSKIHALEGASGARRWQFQDTHPAFALLAGSNGLVYVESRIGRLTALDEARGTIRWQHNTGARTSPPTLGANGILYVVPTSSVPLPNGTLRMKQDLVAVDGVTGQLLWTFPMVSMSTAVTVSPEGKVFAQAHEGTLRALDGRTGTLFWERPLKPWPPNGSPALGLGGEVCVESLSGWKVFALSQTTGATLWEFGERTPNHRWAIGSDGTIYVWSAPVLYALGKGTGARQWEIQLAGSLTSVGTAPDGLIYVGTSEGKLIALQGKTGARLGEFSCDKGAHITFDPVTGPDGSIYATTSDGRLIALAGFRRQTTQLSRVLD